MSLKNAAVNHDFPGLFAMNAAESQIAVLHTYINAALSKIQQRRVQSKAPIVLKETIRRKNHFWGTSLSKACEIYL
jgi:hypothetical protein